VRGRCWFRCANHVRDVRVAWLEMRLELESLGDLEHALALFVVEVRQGRDLRANIGFHCVRLFHLLLYEIHVRLPLLLRHQQVGLCCDLQFCPCLHPERVNVLFRVRANLWLRREHYRSRLLAPRTARPLVEDREVFSGGLLVATLDDSAVPNVGEVCGAFETLGGALVPTGGALSGDDWRVFVVVNYAAVLHDEPQVRSGVGLRCCGFDFFRQTSRDECLPY
jgi:hypothetical protein